MSLLDWLWGNLAISISVEGRNSANSGGLVVQRELPQSSPFLWVPHFFRQEKPSAGGQTSLAGPLQGMGLTLEFPSFSIDPLGEEMAASSSILAWKIPWTEEPAGLQSMASQSDMTERLSARACTHTHTHTHTHTV